MIQEEAIQIISESLKKDAAVKALFLKGSLGRGEQDEFSDVDLYCLVKKEEETAFLERRHQHLSAYGKFLYEETLFIIAPQMIVVYENLLHVDLFTVTEETFKHSDYFYPIYDPEDLLKQFTHKQNLLLSEEDFLDCLLNISWFLFQYRKARMRNNSIWAAAMLYQTTDSAARMLLHHYQRERAQLGIKRASELLPYKISKQFTAFLERLTPSSHLEAVRLLLNMMEQELPWVKAQMNAEDVKKFFPLLTRLMQELRTSFQPN